MPASIASDKYLYWREVMARFQASGLSGMQFCKQEDLKYTAFADWRQRLRKQAQRKAPKYQQIHDWEAVIEKARNHPGGIQQYCADHGICKKTFYKRFSELKHRHPEWRQRKLSRNGGRKRKVQAPTRVPSSKQPGTGKSISEEESFVPVHVVESSGNLAGKNIGIDVILPNSITLRVVPGCSTEFLQSLVSALGGS